jgi:DNA-binding HxlR family transcriptional regulator
MALFDLLGRRWILRIIWELHQAETPPTFRELRIACSDISSSVLTRRLRELTDDLIVTHTGTGYALTHAGEDLVTNMAPLLDWSSAWTRRLDRVSRSAH